MSEKKEAKKAKKAEKKAAKAKGQKSGKGFKIVIAVLLVIAIVGEFYIGLTIPGKIENAITAATSANAGDEGSNSADVTFTAGTYGGVEFKTIADVVNYYNDAYNKTKAKTAQYKVSDGSTQTYFDFFGTENLTLKEGSLLVDGSSNMIVDKMVPGVLSTAFKPNIVPLPPQSSWSPENCNDETGAPMIESRVVESDVSSASVAENADGTVTLTLIPVATEMSSKGMDPQGHFFNSLGKLDDVVKGLGIVTFPTDNVSEYVKATYEGGSAVVTIDPKTGEITAADYHMVVNVDVQHATITALKDKSASLTLLYDNHFPATEEDFAKKEVTKLS